MFNLKNIKVNGKNDTQTGTYKMGLIPSWILTASGLYLMLKIKDMDMSAIYKSDFLSTRISELLKILSHIHF